MGFGSRNERTLGASSGVANLITFDSKIGVGRNLGEGGGESRFCWPRIVLFSLTS